MAINRVAAAVQGVATVVSQQPFFKRCFENILDLLAVSAEEMLALPQKKG